MQQMTSGAEPRVSYAKPTEKPQFGKPFEHIAGTTTADISQYKLPVKRVEEMKNYTPVQKEQFWSLEELRAGDESGTTETDSQTDPNDGGYATSQRKSGKPGRWPNKRS